MEPIVGPVAVAVGADQPGCPQRLEVVADQWLANTQLLGEMGHAQLLAGEQLDNPPSQRICSPPRNRSNAGPAARASESAVAVI